MTAVLDPPPGPGARGGHLDRVGTYLLLERVGAGGLGPTYRARDTVYGRTVALKRIPSAIANNAPRADALESLAERLARVSHPSLATIYECGWQDGELFLAVEYVVGQTLRDVIGGRPLPTRRVLELTLEIAGAISALHHAGVIHGDVRPDNIIITSKGHAKLLDGGLAGFTSGGRLRASASRVLEALPPSATRTLRYLSPEEAAGEPATPQSDIFALGVVIYEMLTGASPFERPTAAGTVVAVMQATPMVPSKRLPTILPELDALTVRAMAKSFERRYPNMDALIAVLHALQPMIEVRRASETGGAKPRAGASRWRWVFIGLGVLAIVLALAWWQRAALPALF